MPNQNSLTQAALEARRDLDESKSVDETTEHDTEDPVRSSPTENEAAAEAKSEPENVEE